MNTLSDLRSTLGEHAERVPDGEAVVRTAGIRHRISVVRRRRRAVGAGGLSLALVLVGAATLVGRGTSDGLPAAPTVLGVKAPTTLRSLGYTYRTDGSSETLNGGGSIEVKASTQPRLVSWTTDRPTVLHLRLPGGDRLTSSLSRFHDFAVLPPGPGGKLQVTVPEGRVGVATYDLTAARPDGVTRDGITFRRTVAHTPLLGAAIGGAGQTEIRTSLDAASGQTRISVLCAGAPSGSTAHVTTADAEITGGCDDDAFDPGANIIGTSSLGHAGRAVPVRVWVSGPGSSAPLPSGSDVRIGVGLYGPVVSQKVAGMPVERVLEYAGHTWDFRRAVVKHASPLRYTTGSEPSLAVVALRFGRAPTDLSFSATGMPTQRSGFAGEGSGSTGPFWVPSDAHVQVTVSRPGALGVGIYERDD